MVDGDCVRPPKRPSGLAFKMPQVTGFSRPSSGHPDTVNRQVRKKPLQTLNPPVLLTSPRKELLSPLTLNPVARVGDVSPGSHMGQTDTLGSDGPAGEREREIFGELAAETLGVPAVGADSGPDDDSAPKAATMLMGVDAALVSMVELPDNTSEGDVAIQSAVLERSVIVAGELGRCE